MMLAPLGIMAMASSAETAFMIGSDRQSRKARTLSDDGVSAKPLL
jgi:hypothetical protein